MRPDTGELAGGRRRRRGGAGTQAERGRTEEAGNKRRPALMPVPSVALMASQ